MRQGKKAIVTSLVASSHDPAVLHAQRKVILNGGAQDLVLGEASGDTPADPPPILTRLSDVINSLGKGHRATQISSKTRNFTPISTITLPILHSSARQQQDSNNHHEIRPASLGIIDNEKPKISHTEQRARSKVPTTPVEERAVRELSNLQTSRDHASANIATTPHGHQANREMSIRIEDSRHLMRDSTDVSSHSTAASLSRFRSFMPEMRRSIPVQTQAKISSSRDSAELPDDLYQQEAGEISEQAMRRTEPVSIASALTGAQVLSDHNSEAAGGDVHEIEADRAAEEVMRHLDYPKPRAERPRQAHASGLEGLGEGRPLSPVLRRRFESTFGWDFSGVRLHTGRAAANLASRIGAHAFTSGRNIVFGANVYNPEANDHRRLLAHEMAHVVQQDMGAGSPASHSSLPLSAASPARVQAAPLVTNVATSAAELGVGGDDITATATVGGPGTRLTWIINPGGAAPAGVTLIGTGRRVRIRASQPGGGLAIGGVPIVIRAHVTGTPGDFFDAPPIMLVQVLSATYNAAPPLVAVPSLIPGAPPANTAEPNRDGIGGNTAVVNAITAPAGRPITVAFRRSLGATLAGTTIIPGSRTGDIGLRITDNATRARLDETQAATAGPAALMADMTVNAVPTRVSALTGAGALGPYGVLNRITFALSDVTHPPLTRIVGELITNGGDDFNIPPPNGAFNPAFLLALAVPANTWNDQLVTPPGILNVTDGRPAIDVNRFVGPGVPHLPRRVIYRQRFQYASWQGAGATVSNTIADGQHIRSLIGSPGAFQFKTEHRFGGVAAPPRIEPYVGNPLIVLTNIVATPTAAGATGLAADGVATANLAVNSSVPGRTVNWSILEGDTTITGGNPAVLPATATLQAGLRVGNFRVRAADSIFPNRRVDGRIRVVAVRLRNLRAAASRVPAGTLATNVTVNAEPGGRNLNWIVDAAAVAAGVTVAPVVTGPGNAMNVTVTRPAGFTGRVTVTATDAVLAARTARVSIEFL